MIETHLNLFDVTVIAVMLLSCIFAFYRGFIREVLSLGAWIGAAIVTIYYFPAATEAIKPHFKSQVGAAGVSTICIYTVSLIGFTLFNSIIIKYVKSGNEVGMLDNFLGLLFGAARGGLIISLGYFMLTIALPEKEYPEWLKHSLTRPYVEMGAIKLVKIAPEYLREVSTLENKGATEISTASHSEPSDDQPENTELSSKENAKEIDVHSDDTHSNTDSGYNPEETNKLKHLLELENKQKPQ